MPGICSDRRRAIPHRSPCAIVRSNTSASIHASISRRKFASVTLQPRRLDQSNLFFQLICYSAIPCVSPVLTSSLGCCGVPILQLEARVQNFAAVLISLARRVGRRSVIVDRWRRHSTGCRASVHWIQKHAGAQRNQIGLQQRFLASQHSAITASNLILPLT